MLAARRPVSRASLRGSPGGSPRGRSPSRQRSTASSPRRRLGVGARAPRPHTQEAVRLENLVFDRVPRQRREEGRRPPRRQQRPSDAGGPATAVTVGVAWGDVTKVDADVYAVGHYQGVLPQHAELALDRAVSGIPEGAELDRSRLVDHAAGRRRGALRGSARGRGLLPVGRIRRNAGGTVAVAGMGRPGTFDAASAAAPGSRARRRRLARCRTSARCAAC